MNLHSSRTQLSALVFVYTSLWRKENKMFAAGWWDVYTTWLNKSFSFYTACLWREKIDGSIVAIYIQRLIHIRVCQILGFFSFHPPFRVYSAFLLIRKKKKRPVLNHVFSSLYILSFLDAMMTVDANESFICLSQESNIYPCRFNVHPSLPEATSG